MKERPILFSDPMVRAILDGTKVQTRRVYKPRCPSPYEIMGESPDGRPWPHVMTQEVEPYALVPCPYGVPGDRLWVREAHAILGWPIEGTQVVYRATTDEAIAYRWRPSIHMPRWACRLVLEVTDVRVEMVQDITPQDAIEEGVTEWATKEQHRLLFDEQGRRRDEPLGPSPLDGTRRGLPYLVNAFADLWGSINAARGYGWDVNPWVWVVSFRRLDDVAQRGAA